MSKSIPIHCAYTQLVPVGEIKPHPKNPNRHPQKQIKLLAKIISHRGWRSPVVISKRSGFVVAGHGRLMAAELIGAETVPCDFQDFPSEKEEIAHLVADNKIAELSETDADALNRVIEDDIRAAGMDVDLAGVLEEIAEGEVRKVSLPPTPKMTWVLIGIETPRFGEINQLVEKIAKIDGTVCEVAAGSK